MAISTTTIQSTSASVAAAGTSVAPVAVVPLNCHTILIYNRDAANTLYVAEGAAGGAINPLLAMVIAPGGSVTIGCGPRSKRPTQAADMPLAFDASAAPTVASITYICGLYT